jgi:hypothetical protein
LYIFSLGRTGTPSVLVVRWELCDNPLAAR